MMTTTPLDVRPSVDGSRAKEPTSATARGVVDASGLDASSPPIEAAVVASAEPSRGTAARWIRPAGIVVLLALVVSLVPGPLGGDARLALFVLGAAIVGWTLTDLDDTKVAAVAAATLVVGGVCTLDEVVAASLDPTVWLLVASFVVAAAVKATGLADRLTMMLAGRSRSVAGLCWSLTIALSLTSFVIPSTSGRAALALPIFLAVASSIDDRRIVRALALLFPTTILLSAIASLVGAGAHLVAAELVADMTGSTMSFWQWTMLGAPFAVVSCGVSTWVILHMFLTPDERRRPVSVAAHANHWGRLGARARVVSVAVVASVALWATEPWHGIEPAIVAMAAAIVLVATGSVSPRAAASSVKLDLVVFLAATLLLGGALVSTGAAKWLLDGALGWLTEDTPSWIVVAAVGAVSLLSHLVVTSRTARATVLLPLVILVAHATSLDPTMLTFVSTAGAGFCLSLPVSAKPVALFSRVEVDTYEASDLARLARVLLPIHLVLLVVFAQFVWPALGL